MLQLSIADLVDAEELEKAKKSIQSKLDGKPRTTDELKLRSRNRDRVYLEINSRLIFKDGTPIGVQGIGRNITERKRAEEALRISERQLRASLEERERLGRDLHDGIIQSLYAAGLNLENSLHVTRGNGGTMEKRVKEVTHDLNRIIREVRGFIMGLEQNRLKGDEFKGALKSLALMAGESKGAAVELLIDETTAAKLSSAEATQLLQIAREAMSNSIRHANAKRLVFELRPSDHGGARFELADDGIGFTPNHNREKGLGLRNMAARAEEIGAEFQIISHLGEGTRIVLDMRRTTAEKVGV
jgi:signal transduction histidine kinase